MQEEDLPPLHVWPHPEVLAWDGTPEGRERPGLLPPFPGYDAPEACRYAWDTDAHAVGYYIPGEEALPRLKVAALRHLLDAGVSPLMGWIFLDVDRPGHAPWPSPEAAETTIGALLDRHGGPGGALATAGVYTTRAGFRLVYRPAEAFPVEVAGQWLRGFIRHLERATGLTIDKVSREWSRCFRLPYVTRDGLPTSPYVDMERLWGPPLDWAPTGNLRAVIEAPARAPRDHGEAPDEIPVVGDDVWRQLGELGEVLQAGEVLAAPPDQRGTGQLGRDQTMIHTLATVAGILGTQDPSVLYGVLGPSVAADESDGAPSLDKLWGRCVHWADLEGAKAAQREALTAAMATAPPILYHGSAYYVLHADAPEGPTYRPPVHAPAVCEALERWGDPSLQSRTSKNKPRQLAEYLADYGRQVVHVIAEMGRKISVFQADVNGGTLLEGVCIPLDVAPVEHPEVDEWLRRLGGEEADRLLDWVATVHRTDRPTCALYLQGTKGSGKNLLASGLAAIWGTGPTDYEDAVGSFNDALARSPLVFADESMASINAKNLSAAFRKLVGSSELRLARKFQPVATLRGSVRMLIAANNPNALALRESLTADDLDAIVDRILHVQVGPNAAQYLRDIGGREATEGWVLKADATPGKIAEHAMWLAENRPITPGKRFLVEGVLTTFHRDLTLGAGMNAAVLAAVAHQLERGQDHPAVQCGHPDGVLVNGPHLRKLWTSLTQTIAPQETEVSGALATLSTGTARKDVKSVGRLRYYVIPSEAVLRVADILQIGDLDILEARIRGKVTGGPQGGQRPMVRP